MYRAHRCLKERTALCNCAGSWVSTPSLLPSHLAQVCSLVQWARGPDYSAPQPTSLPSASSRQTRPEERCARRSSLCLHPFVLTTGPSRTVRAPGSGQDASWLQLVHVGSHPMMPLWCRLDLCHRSPFHPAPVCFCRGCVFS